MPNPQSSDYNDLILKIYEAAVEPGLWEEIALETSDLMNSGATQLLVRNTETNQEHLTVGVRISQQAQKEYLTHYYPKDLRVPSLLKKNIGSLVENHKLLSEEDAKKNRAVTDFFQKNDLDNITGLNLSLGSNFIWFGTSRQGKNNIHSAEELAVIKALGPHIRKSLRLQLVMAGLRSHIGIMGDLWSYTGKAIYILEGQGKVGFMNSYGTALLSGSLLDVRDNRLYFKNDDLQKRFRVIQTAMLTSNDMVSPLQDSFIATDDRGQDYGVRLLRHLDNMPFLPLKFLSNVVVIVTPLNIGQKYSASELDRFSDLFRLTEAEKRVVTAVGNGVNLTKLAHSLGLRPDTIRTQLKTAMRKTATHSQKDLVRLLDRFCFIQMR